MAEGGRSGTEELDPMEDIRRSVDGAVNPSTDDLGADMGAPIGSFHDSESHDPPVSPGDTD